MTELDCTLCGKGKFNPALRGKLLKWLLIPVCVAIAAFMMQRSVALIGLDMHHDTLMFDAARRLLDGQLPFRDFFYQYNLGNVFFHALALKELGVQIASMKMVTALAYAVIAVLIYFCTTSARNWRWSLAAALVWSFLSPFYMPAMGGYHPWSTVYMMAAVMGGALCLVLAIHGRPILWAVLAGGCLNLAFWFKQVAAIQILAVLAWVAYNALCPSLSPDVARRFRRIFLGIGLGGLTSSIPFFFYIFQNGIFEDWWRSAFVFNAYFAASGPSSTGIIALAKTFFPVNRELGYLSVVWSLLPLCLITIIAQRQSAGSGRLFSRSDECSLVSSLFATLAIAGWLEYFPLAHSFHTQLFMAPMFVLMALQLDQIRWNSLLGDRARWPTIALLGLTVAALLSQSYRHIRGLRDKVTAPSVVLRGEMPASGLHLKPDHALSFNRFYNAVLAAQRSATDPELIPMSVDPLRGLLPIIGSESEDFKIGVNWTFPNEIIEPGYNNRLAMRIAERKSPVYADSLIGIPGYVPIALLEMPIGITPSHTLYVPSADLQVLEPPVYVVHDDIFVLSADAFPKAEQVLISNYGERTNFTFVKLDKQVSIPADDMAQLHISIIRSEDIPTSLSKFQYDKYLKAVPGRLAARMAELYKWKEGSRYSLRWPLEDGQMLDIAKFMLSQGKLFESLDRPMYFTTLSQTTRNRPFLAMKAMDSDEMQIFWSKPSLNGRALSKGANCFLVVNNSIGANEEIVFYVQIVMKDGTTKNFYLHYQDKYVNIK